MKLIHPSPHILSMLVVRTFRIPLSNTQVCTALSLTRVTMLCHGSPRTYSLVHMKTYFWMFLEGSTRKVTSRQNCLFFLLIETETLPVTWNLHLGHQVSP